MLIGVDTSGKIGEGNLFAAAVVFEKSDIMVKLREKVAKRHQALANRRRIKASDLKKNELEWFKENLNLKYSGITLGISDFVLIKKAVCDLQDWKIKTLASLFFMLCGNTAKTNDVILIDRDYSEKVMDNIIKYVTYLFNKTKRKVIVEVGTSFNEVIAEADLIAGCMRKKIIRSKNLNTKELISLVKIL